jgi:hypothetical protein
VPAFHEQVRGRYCLEAGDSYADRVRADEQLRGGVDADTITFKIGFISSRQIANVYAGVRHDRTGRIRDDARDLAVLNLCECTERENDASEPDVEKGLCGRTQLAHQPLPSGGGRECYVEAEKAVADLKSERRPACCGTPAKQDRGSIQRGSTLRTISGDSTMAGSEACYYGMPTP